MSKKLFLAGVIALALSGCRLSLEAPAMSAPAGVLPEEFVVTLSVGGGGASRSVVGPEAGTVRFGLIRNVAQQWLAICLERARILLRT